MRARSITLALTVAVLAGTVQMAMAKQDEKGRGQKEGRPQKREIKTEYQSDFMKELREYGKACKLGQAERAKAIERKMQRRFTAMNKQVRNDKSQKDRQEGKRVDNRQNVRMQDRSNRRSDIGNFDQIRKSQENEIRRPRYQDGRGDFQRSRAMEMRRSNFQSERPERAMSGQGMRESRRFERERPCAQFERDLDRRQSGERMRDMRRQDFRERRFASNTERGMCWDGRRRRDDRRPGPQPQRERVPAERLW